MARRFSNALRLCILLLSVICCRYSPGARPNIVMVMADDLGMEWLSCYGGQDFKTPHIDKLAADGMRFTSAYSMPKCTPTRATLLTGRYPFRHGWIGHWDVPRWGAGCHFDPRHNVSFARILKKAGYATVAAGKWQINDFRVQSDCMQQHGFDESCMWTGFETGVPASSRRYWDPYININGQSRTHQGRFGTDVFTDFLIDFFRRHRDEPFLAYFPMALPHTPFVATPRNPQAQGKEEQQKAMVAYVDQAVGKLTSALKELGLQEQTIFIFTTDNGSTRGVSARRDGRIVRGGKDTFWETGMNAPFIVSCPGLVPRGKVTDELTDFTDILPTFAELAGAKIPAHLTIDGKSIAPLLLGQTKHSPRKWILAMGVGTMARDEQGVASRSPDADRVIRNKKFKLWHTEGKSSALYNLQQDPAESKNILHSSNPQAIAARKQLEGVLLALPADKRPQYDPTPPQIWDRKISDGKRKTKKRRRK